MNKVVLVGRLTRNPEVRYAATKSGESTCIARYTLAVNRRTRDAEADFISCVAFGKNGEFAEKWLKQGSRVGISGRIQTGSYTNKDGNKVYTTDVIVEEQEFAESKREAEAHGGGSYPHAPAPAQAPDADGFLAMPDGIDEELPFN